MCIRDRPSRAFHFSRCALCKWMPIYFQINRKKLDFILFRFAYENFVRHLRFSCPNMIFWNLCLFFQKSFAILCYWSLECPHLRAFQGSIGHISLYLEGSRENQGCPFSYADATRMPSWLTRDRSFTRELAFRKETDLQYENAQPTFELNNPNDGASRMLIT